MTDCDQTIERWLAALNSGGALSLVEQACSAEICIRRFGYGERRGQPVEEIRGVEAVATWLALPAPGTVFHREGVCEHIVREQGPWYQARYRVEVADFVGGGLWSFTLSDEGTLQTLEHRPDDLSPS